MLAAVRRLATPQQVGVLWATHLIEEIKVTDRVLFLEQGLIRFDGAPDDYLSQCQGQTKALAPHE
jgi:ABC-2 type transport system ATP-binding protein